MNLGFTTLLLYGHIGLTQGYVPRPWAMDFIILEKVFMLIKAKTLFVFPLRCGRREDFRKCGIVLPKVPGVVKPCISKFRFLFHSKIGHELFLNKLNM